MGMIEKLTFFSSADGNLLIRLILAHLIADFVLQTNSMVSQKKWLSTSMAVHIGIVFTAAAIISGNLVLALGITICHWLIDGAKIEVGKRKWGSENETSVFIIDQLFHIISIVLIWSVFLQNWSALWLAIRLPFTNYKCSLVLLGYVIVSTPIGYLIGHATAGMNKATADKKEGNQHGGKLIGIFERMIILTMVLLGQYAAIGFLITGKSIIRFANNDEHLRSEYVLVGTMMSYALAIMTGAAINWLLTL
jgi:hypothetical protein